MLAAYLNSEGASAEYILSSDIILTDGVFQNAKPVMSETTKMVKARLNPLLNAGTIPCVTGFFGRTPTGEVATFGRGGSDLTASVLAHALDANAVSCSACSLWFRLLTVSGLFVQSWILEGQEWMDGKLGGRIHWHCPRCRPFKHHIWAFVPWSRRACSLW